VEGVREGKSESTRGHTMHGSAVRGQMHEKSTLIVRTIVEWSDTTRMLIIFRVHALPCLVSQLNEH